MSTSFAHRPIVTNGLIFAIDANNKKSYISGDTTTFDLTKNSSDGTLTNGVAFSGGSFVFDGINDHIVIGDIPVLETQDFTISSWVKRASTGTNNSIIGVQYQNIGIRDISGYSLSFRPSDDKLIMNLSLTSSSNFNVSVSDSTYTDITRLYNMVVTKSGTDVNIYVDGELDGTDTLPTSKVDYSTENIHQTSIGVRYESISGQMPPQGFTVAPFNGSIGICMLYNRGLSAAEVQQNHNAMKHRFLI